MSFQAFQILGLDFFSFRFSVQILLFPCAMKNYSHPLSYLCSHTQTIPDHSISLWGNTSILHHLDIWSSCLFFLNRYSIINASVHKGWFWWWFSLDEAAMSISNLNYAFLFIISETGILSYSDHLSLQEKNWQILFAGNFHSSEFSLSLVMRLLGLREARFGVLF